MPEKKLIKQLIELNNQYYKDFAIDHEDGILRDHNIKVYEKIIKGFIRGNKVLFEQATGTGKTYLALKFLHDHAKGKRVLFVSPTNAIQNSFVETYKKLLGEDFDCELDTCLYQGIKGKQKKKYDIIIFDEVHRMGAKTWGPNAETLMNNNPSASILGMTATLERPDGVDVTKFFDEKKPVSRITLVQALERGILPKPNYTLAKVDFTDDSKFIDTCIKDFREKLKTAEDEEKEEILEFLNRLKKAKQAIAESEDIPAIFAHELRTDELKQGKFIVFCPSGEDDEETAESITKMKAIMKQATKWFAGIDGVKKIKKYSVYSKLDANKNKKIIEAFEEDDSKALKLLFSINMLNEGLHVDDIDGVIMLRSTGSRIIYLQQLGRALSVGHKQQPKIFDFVANLNYVDIESIQQMVTDVNASKNGCGNKYGNDGNMPESTDFEDLQFKLTIDNLETLQLIDALKQNIFDYNHRNDFVFDDFYSRLLQFREEFGHVNVPYEYKMKDGYPLHAHLNLIRVTKRWIGTDKATKYKSHLLTEEQYNLLDRIDGFKWNITFVPLDDYFNIVKDWFEKYKTFKAGGNSTKPDGKITIEYNTYYNAQKIIRARFNELEDRQKEWLIERGFLETKTTKLDIKLDSLQKYFQIVKVWYLNNGSFEGGGKSRKDGEIVNDFLDYNNARTCVKRDFDYLQDEQKKWLISRGFNEECKTRVKFTNEERVEIVLSWFEKYKTIRDLKDEPDHNIFRAAKQYLLNNYDKLDSVLKFKLESINFLEQCKNSSHKNVIVVNFNIVKDWFNEFKTFLGAGQTTVNGKHSPKYLKYRRAREFVVKNISKLSQEDLVWLEEHSFLKELKIEEDKKSNNGEDCVGV